MELTSCPEGSTHDGNGHTASHGTGNGAHAQPGARLRIGIVLSGGQAPGRPPCSPLCCFVPSEYGCLQQGCILAGGHNVIAGLLDFLLERHPGSSLLGFRGGPKGVLTKSFMDITEANMVSLPALCRQAACMSGLKLHACES